MAIFDKPENTLNLGPFFDFFGTPFIWFFMLLWNAEIWTISIPELKWFEWRIHLIHHSQSWLSIICCYFLTIVRWPLLPLSLSMKRKKCKHRRLSMRRLNKRWERNWLNGWHVDRKSPWCTCLLLLSFLLLFTGLLGSVMPASFRSSLHCQDKGF